MNRVKKEKIPIKLNVYKYTVLICKKFWYIYVCKHKYDI